MREPEQTAISTYRHSTVRCSAYRENISLGYIGIMEKKNGNYSDYRVYIGVIRYTSSPKVVNKALGTINGRETAGMNNGDRSCGTIGTY